MEASEHKSRLPAAKTIFRILALFASFIFVTGLYEYWIHPQAAEAAIRAELIKAANPELPNTASRSLFVILQDFEQQICLSLMFWACLMLIQEYYLLARERRCFTTDFLPLKAGERVIPEQAIHHSNEVKALLETNPKLSRLTLPKAIINGLQRFNSTHSIPAVSDSINSTIEFTAEAMDNNLTLIRYIGWAIPSIGFIGTVRGIGEALAQSESAIQGDISGVTASLGLAFNSTLVALVLSIVLTFFLFLLQASQDRLSSSLGRYCQEQLLNKMKTPPPQAEIQI